MATYYWVGGSGTWDATTTTHWATSSGGTGGAGVPSSTDTVNFDSGSGTTATVTVSSTATCSICIVNKSDINISLGASVTLCNTVTNSFGAGSIFNLTSGTLSLNSYTLTVKNLGSSNSNASTIAFGTGSITIPGYAYRSEDHTSELQSH